MLQTTGQLLFVFIMLCAVYFRFAKAFDLVCCAKLIHKLAAYGIAGDVFNCLTDFLHNVNVNVTRDLRAMCHF